MSDCKFRHLTDFRSMCEGCINLRTFDYFSSDYVAYSDTSYQKPTDMQSIVNACNNLELFSFTLGYAGMHKLESGLNLAFSGCQNLRSIGFPSAVVASSQTGNLGIKVKLDFSPVTAFNNSTQSFTFFLAELPNWLYNFTDRGEIPLSET